MESLLFTEFPKMARLSRECVITEKIDGTNAQVLIAPVEDFPEQLECFILDERDGMFILAGSRTRYVTPDNDNMGFAGWVRSHAGELFGLGQGRHFGEWWGSGIQRRYGLNEKRFSMFNTIRWHLFGAEPLNIAGPYAKEPKYQEQLPECCGLVPVLYRGVFTTDAIEDCLRQLKENGSQAAPGFMDPEGVVVFHVAAGVGFKKTFDDKHKGA